MALKAVCASPSSSGAAKTGNGGTSDIAALLGAGGAQPAAGSDSAGQASAAAPVNFLQMLAQTASSGNTATAPAKAQDPKASEKASVDSGAGTTPDLSAAALSLILQSMAAALAPASAAASAAAAPVKSAPPSGASSTAASSGALGAIGTNAGPAQGTSPVAGGVSGTDANAAQVKGSGAMQSLLAQLAQDSDSDPQPAPQAATPDNSQLSSTQTNAVDRSTSSVNASAAAGQMSAGSHFALQHSALAPNIELKTQVASSAWADELGGKVTWMAHQGIESASLTLSPEHLGPVEVHISVQDGGTSVWFGAAQADTRTALENALPRLREMFATQGMTLADAGVSREAPKQQARQTAAAAITGISGVSNNDTSVASLMRIRLGLLDTYA